MRFTEDKNMTRRIPNILVTRARLGHFKSGLKCFIDVDFSPVSVTMKSERAPGGSLFKSEALMNFNRLKEGVDHLSAFHFLKVKHPHETPVTYPDMSRRSPFTSTLRFIAGCFVFALLVSVFCVGSSWAATDAPEDVKAYHSPYVWRTDGTGDFVLPVIAEKMEYVSQPVSVQGTITSVTATWQASGPVAVWVSADAGLHYTAVVNGVPLTTGFTKGETLKWKAVLGDETALSEVTLAFTSASGVSGTFGTPELSGFLYRKPFKIAGSSAGTLYNYQVLVRVGESSQSSSADISCGGRILADFNDVRFTLADGETLAPYALIGLTGKKPARTATYFVRIPQVPKDGVVVFIYYGNPVAQSLSSPKDTFDFYEDFTALNGSLDPAKWSVTLGTGGSAQVTSEGLLLDAAALTSKTFEFKQGMIEYVADAVTGYETRLIARDPDPAGATDATLVAYASGLDGAQHCLVVDNIVKANDPKPAAAGTYYGFRLIADKDNNLTFERYDENFSEKQATVSYKDTEGPAKGFLALKTTGLGLGRSLTKFRWIRCRKYASPEPVVDASSLTVAEESAVLPIFTNTTLDGKKDIVLSGSAKTGQYTTAETKADFDIRIITPVWEGKGVTVDVSADAGKTYKKNCVDSSYYYASQGDFTLGKALRARLTLKKESDSMPSVEYLSVSYKPGTITLIEPNGGGSVATGAVVPLSWTAWDYEKTYPLRLDYSLDGGRTFVAIAPSVLNSGSYLWTVPAKKAMVTTQALIRISDSADAAVYDTSDQPFAIVVDKVTDDSTSGATSTGTEESSAAATTASSGKQAASTTVITEVTTVPSGPQLYELAIMPRDNDPSDPGAYKKGDVVVIMPAGYNWTENELKSFHIVKAYLTAEEKQELLQPKSTDTKARKGKTIGGRRQFRVNLDKQGKAGELKDAAIENVTQ